MEMLFERDPVTKSQTWFVHEDGARQARLIEQQDAQPVLDHLVLMRQHVTPKPGADLKYVGSIPMSWYHKLRPYLQDKAFLARFFAEHSKLMFQKP